MIDKKMKELRAHPTMKDLVPSEFPRPGGRAGAGTAPFIRTCVKYHHPWESAAGGQMTDLSEPEMQYAHICSILGKNKTSISLLDLLVRNSTASPISSHVRMSTQRTWMRSNYTLFCTNTYRQPRNRWKDSMISWDSSMMFPHIIRRKMCLSS